MLRACCTIQVCISFHCITLNISFGFFFGLCIYDVFIFAYEFMIYLFFPIHWLHSWSLISNLSWFMLCMMYHDCLHSLLLSIELTFIILWKHFAHYQGRFFFLLSMHVLFKWRLIMLWLIMIFYFIFNIHWLTN